MNFQVRTVSFREGKRPKLIRKTLDILWNSSSSSNSQDTSGGWRKCQYPKNLQKKYVCEINIHDINWKKEILQSNSCCPIQFKDSASQTKNNYSIWKGNGVVAMPLSSQMPVAITVSSWLHTLANYPDYSNIAMEHWQSLVAFPIENSDFPVSHVNYFTGKHKGMWFSNSQKQKNWEQNKYLKQNIQQKVRENHDIFCSKVTCYPNITCHFWEFHWLPTPRFRYPRQWIVPIESPEDFRNQKKYIILRKHTKIKPHSKLFQYTWCQFRHFLTFIYHLG